MKFVIIGIVMFLSFLLGTFGFSQIVGTLKYFRNFKLSSALFTIILWGLILGFAAFAVINWISDYKIALFIGYTVSFLLSLGTKPD